MINNLKKVRLEKKVLQQDMAKALGKPVQTINNWEKSQSLHPEKMKQCADYLGVAVNELFEL